jgi:hypothetical protein
MLYTPADYEYFQNLVEEEYCVQHNLIVDRVVLDIKQNDYLYNLPASACSVRRITYRGRKLEPFSGQEQINSGSTPFNYSQGEPRQYIYNYLGQRVIRLFPTPAENLPALLGEDPWNGSTIRNKCVVEFFSLPDLTNEYKRIPDYLRAFILRDEVLFRMCQMDTQTFDTKAQARYNQKSKRAKEVLLKIKSKLYSCTPKNMEPYLEQLQQSKVQKPSLPWNFGRPVY